MLLVSLRSFRRARLNEKARVEGPRRSCDFEVRCCDPESDRMDKESASSMNPADLSRHTAQCLARSIVPRPWE